MWMKFWIAFALHRSWAVDCSWQSMNSSNNNKQHPRMLISVSGKKIHKEIFYLSYTHAHTQFIVQCYMLEYVQHIRVLIFASTDSNPELNESAGRFRFIWLWRGCIAVHVWTTICFSFAIVFFCRISFINITILQNKNIFALRMSFPRLAIGKQAKSFFFYSQRNLFNYLHKLFNHV